MALDYKLYLHDSDKAAMAALKAIPGFSQVMKAFMKIWSEQQLRLINMSTNLRLNEKQMAKYYNMLPPICTKLGIDVPELFVELDVHPNAYTYGDTKPFIVITSGLFETLPDELIPTVLAHECGHIACHHTLYTTMGRAILNGASAFVSGLGNIALYPIQLAFAYWMRCSEFSADRAAIICDGSAEKSTEVMMRFAGYDKDIMADDPVDGLDVAVLQDNLLAPVLGIGDPKTDKRIDFVGGIRGLSELEKRCREDCVVAFSMYATSIAELFAVADAGKLMPPKSTWFEPKLRSGLFIHRI